MIAIEVTLQCFPFSEKRAGIRRPFDNRLIEFPRELKGFDEKKVASDQSVLEPEFPVGRLFAAPGVRTVNNVVMKQCCRVNEFYCGCDIDDVLCSFATESKKAKRVTMGLTLLPPPQIK